MEDPLIANLRDRRRRPWPCFRRPTCPSHGAGDSSAMIVGGPRPSHRCGPAGRGWRRAANAAAPGPRAACRRPRQFPYGLPHSEQNLGAPSVSAPQWEHFFFGLMTVLHSGQNFPPWVLAPHLGHTAAATCARSRWATKSTALAFWTAWSLAACACAAAISSSRSGAQVSHKPAFLFQHTGSHTQLPQRVHCLNSGLISSTAAFSAASCCGPARAAEETTQQRGRGVGGRGRRAEFVAAESGHVAVAALPAEELELKPAARLKVGVVVGERNGGHAMPSRCHWAVAVEPARRATIVQAGDRMPAPASAHDRLANRGYLTPAMSDPSAPAARLSAALADRYRIERELGAGGMATVYLARDVKHDREVALKVLRPELAAVLGAERFLNEVRITARLDHPHILTLIDSGESDGFLWYALPFIRGESLRATLERERQLGIDEALAITRQIANALDFAHQHGVVHRDIKPENILLHEGEAMLADFGIALAVKEAGGNRITETGLSLGTPQYMSPEQATGDRQVDARSDVYSLGAVLYEMLAGEPPVTGPTAQAIIAKLLTERPTRLRVVRDSVPEGVDLAVAKALAKTPADRFASAGDFVAAFHAT